MPDAALPEVQRTSLVGAVLYLKSLQLDIDLLTFSFLDRPEPAALQDALRQLLVRGGAGGAPGRGPQSRLARAAALGAQEGGPGGRAGGRAGGRCLLSGRQLLLGPGLQRPPRTAPPLTRPHPCTQVLDAIDRDGDVTPMGLQMALLPLDPALARALLAAHQLGWAGRAAAAAFAG